MSIFDPKKFPRSQSLVKAGDYLDLTEEDLYVKFAGVASGDYFFTSNGLRAQTDIICEWRGADEQRIAKMWYWNSDSEDETVATVDSAPALRLSA